MSKAVLISIRPEWCRLIESGKKTIEVRKTKPQIDTPFKCYIYQTLPKYGDWNESDGHVIGEFVCNEIDVYDYQYCTHPEIGMDYDCGDNWFCIDEADLAKACLSYADFRRYAANKDIYGWHISDPVIYDKPKQLSEFYKWFDGVNDIRPCQNGKHCKHLYYDYSEGCQACGIDFDGTDCPYYKVQKAPQSWQYVEEL